MRELEERALRRTYTNTQKYTIHIICLPLNVHCIEFEDSWKTEVTENECFSREKVYAVL